DLQHRLQTLAAEGTSLPVEEPEHPTPLLPPPPPRFDRTAPMADAPPRSADVRALRADSNGTLQRTIFSERMAWQWQEPPSPASMAGAAIPPMRRPASHKTRLRMARLGIILAALVVLALLGWRWFPR